MVWYTEITLSGMTSELGETRSHCEQIKSDANDKENELLLETTPSYYFYSIKQRENNHVNEMIGRDGKRAPLFPP